MSRKETAATIPEFPASLEVHTIENSEKYSTQLRRVILWPSHMYPPFNYGVLDALVDTWGICRIMDVDSQINPRLEKFASENTLEYHIHPVTMFEDGQVPFGGIVNTAEILLEEAKQTEGKLLVMSRQALFVPGVLYYTALRKLRFSVENAAYNTGRKCWFLEEYQLEGLHKSLNKIQ